MEYTKKNEILAKPATSALQIFISQFQSILVLLLIIAAGASFFLSDLIDGLLIMLIIIVNAIFGFIQEYKAEKSIAALNNMTITKVRVVRGGQEQEIDSRDVVVGDIIILEEGNKVPADGILTESINCEINEAALTGESIPVLKSTNESDYKVFLGTLVARGRAQMHVTAIGMDTKFGKIAQTLSHIEDQKTPLQVRIKNLSILLGILAICASGTVFILGYLSGQPLVELVLTSISLAVASVPEGLPAVITVTLAVGTQRMARKKALLRRLASIEALGSTTIIATDKTGTLTKNEMRVTQAWYADKKSHELMIKAGVICNNAQLVFKHNHGSFDILGDTTEGALLHYADQQGTLIENAKKDGELIEEFAFDAKLKIMSVVWKQGSHMYLYTKGAPETILERSAHISASHKQEITKAFEKFGNQGLRVIALAYKPLSMKPSSRTAAEKDLIFLGLVGISDPPREEVKGAIALARQAGIKTIMITGDNERTANAIATHIGLIQEGDEIITGEQLREMSQDALLQKLDSIRVFARTTPDQKLAIVTLFQKKGHIVAVTGDGVNDALALKQADVGVAMGITGTDVSKEAADMIITDDNYATLVTAIEEGRVIFNNIKATIKYLVGSNLGEVSVVLLGMIIGWPLIFSPLHLLYINLVSDGLPALSLAVNPEKSSVMEREFRTGRGTLNSTDIWWFIEVNTLTVLITLGAFSIGLQYGGVATARTLAFTSFVIAQTCILIDVWLAHRSLFSKNIRSNGVFIAALAIPLIMQPILLYTPALARMFNLVPLSAQLLGVAVLFGVSLLLASETRKAVKTHLFNN